MSIFKSNVSDDTEIVIAVLDIKNRAGMAMADEFSQHSDEVASTLRVAKILNHRFLITKIELHCYSFSAISPIDKEAMYESLSHMYKLAQQEKQKASILVMPSELSSEVFTQVIITHSNTK